MPIDYSKWKDIEISDDEDDTHPNIDTPSLYREKLRWRHQARLERMAEKKQKKDEVELGKDKVINKMTELENRLASASTDEEKKAVQKEIDDIKKQEEDFHKKELELEEAEKLEKWNVDTIGHVSMDKTRINKVTDKKVEPPKLSDEEDSKRMADFFDNNECLLQQYAKLPGPKDAFDFLTLHPHLSCDYAGSWLTIEALNMAIDEKHDTQEFKYIAQNSIIIQYIIELAKSQRAFPTNITIIKAFFHKFLKADESYMKIYRDEVAAFMDRLMRRGKEKRDKALEEYNSAEREKRIAEAPGGLDPREVFEELPQEMQEAFESQDVGALQKISEKMDKEVFLYHFERCIKSGLWVPGKEDAEDAEEGKTEAVEEVAPAKVG